MHGDLAMLLFSFLVSYNNTGRLAFAFSLVRPRPFRSHTLQMRGTSNDQAILTFLVSGFSCSTKTVSSTVLGVCIDRGLLSNSVVSSPPS